MGLVFGLPFALRCLADLLGLSAALGRTRLAKLGLFLVLARVAHQGSRLSAVRWARDHPVAEVLGLGPFDEDDLDAALSRLCLLEYQIDERNTWRGCHDRTRDRRTSWRGSMFTCPTGRV